MIYTPEFEQQVIAWAETQQSKGRFAHTQRVVATVTALAEKHAPQEVMVCRIAAWIHDCAKKYADADLLRMAQERRLSISSSEHETPMLLHGIVAYALATEKFNLADERLRTACANHTTGSAHMNVIDKLVFLADKMEPDRDFPGVGEIRDLAQSSLDEAIILFLDGSIRYLLDKRAIIAVEVLEFYNLLIRSP